MPIVVDLAPDATLTGAKVAAKRRDHRAKRHLWPWTKAEAQTSKIQDFTPIARVQALPDWVESILLANMLIISMPVIEI